jgi:iron complex outermembrane receptor protein
MLVRSSYYRFWVLFFIIFFALNAHSQNGTIKGEVKANDELLPYASLSLIGTNYGATSSKIGVFEIKNVPAGTYQLDASNVGFRSQLSSVIVEAGKTTTINIKLQEITSKLDEVVVTGVSRATQLRKSPVPIATLSKKELDMNVSGNLIEAIAIGVPGVSATSTGPNISKPFIRGLGYNRVLNMYDGIRQESQQWGDEHGTEVDQYGIEKAEVVKGPASLIYGSDAIAGVINMIPAVPKGVDGVPKGDFLVDYQGNNGMIATSLGASYSKNGWRYYLRGTQKRAHDYRNPVDGYVYATGFREYNLSSTARVDKNWGFSQLSATLYDNQQEIPDGSRDSATRKFTYPIYDDGRDDIKNRPIVSESRLKEYKIGDLHQRIQHYRLYSHNRYYVGKGNLNMTLGLQQSRRREFLYATVPDKAALYLVLNTLNYELKYNLPTWNGIETTIGVNGMYQNNKSKDATDFPIPDYTLFDIGNYVFMKKTLGKLDVSSGLRFDTRHLTWDNLYTGINANGFGQRVDANTTNAYLQYREFTRRYKGVSGGIGATYNINDHLLLKANFARGYRSPNINEVGANGLDPGAHIRYKGNRDFLPEFNFQKDISFLAYILMYPVFCQKLPALQTACSLDSLSFSLSANISLSFSLSANISCCCCKSSFSTGSSTAMSIVIKFFIVINVLNPVINNAIVASFSFFRFFAAVQKGRNYY